MNKLVHHSLPVTLGFIGYFIFAKLGLYFALPPGFASPIWPAAGVALAIYLIWGWSSLIGTFLASFLANFGVNNPDAFDLASSSFWLPIMFASATCIQLVVTKLLLHQFCSIPTALDSGPKIITFLLFIGPVACLTATSIAHIGLQYIHDMPFNELVFSWLNWGIGDAIGTVFFAPVILILFKNQYVEATKYKLVIILPTLVLFLIVTILFEISRVNISQERKLKFVDSTKNIVEQAISYDETIKQYLYSLRGFFQSNENVTRVEFKAFTDIILSQNPTIRALAWIPKVTKEQRANFEEKLSQEGFENNEIRAISFSNKIVVADTQEQYFPILYTEPLTPNKAAVGLDVWSHPIVGSTVKESIDSNNFALSPTLSLIQQRNRSDGLVVYFPVYKHFESSEIIGLVEVVFEVEDLFNKIYTKEDKSYFSFQVSRVGEGNENAIYASSYYNEKSYYKHQKTINWFNSKIIFRFQSTKDYEQKSINWFSWITIVGGSLLSVFCLFFLINTTGFNQRLSKIINQRTKDLRQANEELKQANHAKNIFLANMSHEYRTPLNAIIGFCQLGKIEAENSKALEHFENISSASNLLLGIINSVLDLSKISEGSFALLEQPFNLNDSINRMNAMFAHKAEIKGLKFSMIRPKEIDVLLIGDQVRVEQIVVNLIDNAIKFSVQGEIQIEWILTSISEHRAELKITVADQGIGIEKDKLEDLFAPFTQEDSSVNREFGGAGIGMSITKQLVDLMNGHIHVYSVKNHGSEFIVTLPFKTIELSSNNAILPLTFIPESFAHYSVLLVEDNSVNQIVAKRIFELFDLSVIIAENGQRALDLLAKESVDLIFMDLHMPVMSGFECIEAIQSNKVLKEIPIVILTASITIEEQAKAEKLQIEEYLVKPFKVEDIGRVLNKYFKPKNRKSDL